MNRVNWILFVFFICIISDPVLAESNKYWYQTIGSHFAKTWNAGNIELYLPIRTIHMPFAYSDEQRNHYTENPYGFGIGKGYYNSSGNYEGMLIMGFQDSHGKPEYIAGYGWIPTWSFIKDTKTGVGVVGLINARSDFSHYRPFPGALPIFSMTYKQLNIQATYVPPAVGSGNIVFAWIKWTFE